MFDKAIIQEKSKELLAVENVALESDALTIIRLCRDLLAVTRGLRETWCLESIKVTAYDNANKESEEQMAHVTEGFNNLIDRIAAVEKTHPIGASD